MRWYFNDLSGMNYDPEDYPNNLQWCKLLVKLTLKVSSG